jgi:hypothetical protein
MLLDPDASAGKIPDTDVQAIMTQTTDSPMDVMFFIRGDNRYVWHSLQNVEDFNTASRHTSSNFYCTDWHCDDGSTDDSYCGSEGAGCPVTAHGRSGVSKKIYVDGHYNHYRYFHSHGGICGLPNYRHASIWVYVR